MFPWKRFVGPVSAVTLLTAGAFAAGSDVMPFSHASRSTSPNVVLEEVPAVDDDAPVVPADEVADDTTTTTESDTPDADTPDADTPDTDTPDTGADAETDGDADADEDADVTLPVVIVDVPAEPGPAAAPAPADVADAPPAVPAENDAPAVCAAAAEAKCGPADADPAAAGTFDSKVQRCQAWWNRLADRLDDRGRDRWAERARRVADRCEAIIARWQERHDRKVKGDHNCDGHPDNGWHNKERPVCPEPAARSDRPARTPKPDRGDRPETAPGQLRKNR